MNDGIIKGNGNSRYLKSVSDFLTQYPTYEAFAAALTAGTLPVDFNGINEDGWQQIGDILGKKTLLQDQVADKYGKNNISVPNDIFEILSRSVLINESKSSLESVLGSKIADLPLSNASIEEGYYTGTGTSSPSVSIHVTKGTPVAFFVIGPNEFLDNLPSYSLLAAIRGMWSVGVYLHSNMHRKINVGFNEDYVSWSTNYDDEYFNYQGENYNYIVLCI